MDYPKANESKLSRKEIMDVSSKSVTVTTSFRHGALPKSSATHNSRAFDSQNHLTILQSSQFDIYILTDFNNEALYCCYLCTRRYWSQRLRTGIQTCHQGSLLQFFEWDLLFGRCVRSDS
jgi:hypothetical protein